jgi:hypothetical protein
MNDDVSLPRHVHKGHKASGPLPDISLTSGILFPILRLNIKTSNTKSHKYKRKMSSKPHSKTVRGTFDNPKTKEAINSDKKPPQLGDPTSLKPENSSKELPANDSAPPGGESNDSGANVGAPTPSNSSGELPHSKKVRGTLANKDGKKVNKSQLGDPASLKAETSKTEMDKSTEREGSDKSGKSKL